MSYTFLLLRLVKITTKKESSVGIRGTREGPHGIIRMYLSNLVLCLSVSHTAKLSMSTTQCERERERDMPLSD